MVFLVFWILLNLEKEEEMQAVLAVPWFSETQNLMTLLINLFLYNDSIDWFSFKKHKSSANVVYHAQYSNTPRNFLKIKHFIFMGSTVYQWCTTHKDNFLYLIKPQRFMKVTWHTAKYGDPYLEFMLCIYPSKVCARTHTHTEQWAAI